MPLAKLLQFISYAHLSIALYVKVSKDQYFFYFYFGSVDNWISLLFN